MLNDRNLVLDTMSEVYNLLRPWADAEFWNFSEHEPIPGSIYVLGRQQVVEHKDRIIAMAQDTRFVIVFGNSAEGSITLRDQCDRVLGLGEYIRQGQILLISGGDLEPDWPYIRHDHFLVRILDYAENLQEISRAGDIFNKIDKPYRFLFLNGRARPHRKYLWEKFRLSGLLDQCLWTMLDGRGSGSRILSLMHEGQQLLSTNTPITRLPRQYEVTRYQNTEVSPDHRHHFAKHELFNYEWGDVYLRADPYIDTYFSLVTETVFEYPYSFRTEKIAKVLAIGHPWICATSHGWYRDLRNLGFRTFGSIIDESFDLIDGHQQRMDRVYDIVVDLCQQDLSTFLAACEPICKYNQQRLQEFQTEHRREFPDHFQKFLDKHARS